MDIGSIDPSSGQFIAFKSFVVVMVGALIRWLCGKYTASVGDVWRWLKRKVNMRDFFLLLLTLAAITLGITAYSQSQAIQALQASVAAMPAATDLDLQAKCTKQAADDIKAGDWPEDQQPIYFDHYNATLQKCFLLIETADYKSSSDSSYHSDSLIDAFEMKDYGDYNAINYYDKSKPPYIECAVAQSDGTRSTCQSEADFKAAAEYYMGPDL